MLQRFVVQTFLLDLTSLIHGFHGSEHTSSFGQSVELHQHGFLNQVRQFLYDECTLDRVLILGQSKLFVDDELDCHRSSHTLLSWCGDRLIVSIGVKRIAVIVDGVKRLQRGSDIIEIDLLRVQTSAARLDVILEHLCPRISTIFLLECLGPNSSRNATDNRIFRVDSVAEEEA